MIEEVRNYIEKLIPPHQELAKAIRDLILEHAPGFQEEFKWKMPFYDLFFIQEGNGYVKLGYWYGSILEDPQQLLVGTGKKARYVKVFSLKEFEDLKKDLIRLIKESVEIEHSPKRYDWGK